MILFRWPSRFTFSTCRDRSWSPRAQSHSERLVASPSPGEQGRTLLSWQERADTHVYYLKLPEVFHSVDRAVATREEGLDVILQPQGVEPCRN